MPFPATATFGQLLPFQTSFGAKLFSSPETAIVWLTRQQKARTQMTTKATGLCAKSRRAVDGGVSRVQKLGIVRMSNLRMLKNVLKPKQTATVHARKHLSWGLGRNWAKMAKKCHLLPKSGIDSSVVKGLKEILGCCEVRNVREVSTFCCFLTLGVWVILIAHSNVKTQRFQTDATSKTMTLKWQEV